MNEITPDIERILASLSTDEWDALCARVRPPGEGRVSTKDALRSLRSTRKIAQKYISQAEAATLLGVTDRTVRSAIRDGRLKGYQFGRTVRLRIDQVEAAMAPIASARSATAANNRAPDGRYATKDEK
jgi:excisionase family DNA binding protein